MLISQLNTPNILKRLNSMHHSMFIFLFFYVFFFFFFFFFFFGMLTQKNKQTYILLRIDMACFISGNINIITFGFLMFQTSVLQNQFGKR